MFGVVLGSVCSVLSRECVFGVVLGSVCSVLS